MIIDIVLCILVLLLALVQYRRGALLGFRGLLALAGAGYLTFRFQSQISQIVAEHLKKQNSFPAVELVTTAVLFILFALVLHFLLGLIVNAIRTVGVARKADSLLGGVFGLLEGAVLVVVAGVVLGAMDRYHLVSSASFSAQIEASHLVSLTRGLASRVIIH